MRAQLCIPPVEHAATTTRRKRTTLQSLRDAHRWLLRLAGSLVQSLAGTIASLP
jgi:hypothetical protein